MISIANEVITWPINDPDRARAMSDAFVALGRGEPRLQKIIGALDGKLVIIRRPSENGNSYIDRKQHTSMSLLAVADANGRFTYVKTGHSGRNHDARVFNNTVLYSKMLFDPERWFPNDSYILGDSAYPILPNLITLRPGGSEAI